MKPRIVPSSGLPKKHPIAAPVIAPKLIVGPIENICAGGQRFRSVAISHASTQKNAIPAAAQRIEN